MVRTLARASWVALALTGAICAQQPDPGLVDTLAFGPDAPGNTLQKALASGSGYVHFHPALAGGVHYTRSTIVVPAGVVLDGDIDGNGRPDIRIELWGIPPEDPQNSFYGGNLNQQGFLFGGAPVGVVLQGRSTLRGIDLAGGLGVGVLCFGAEGLVESNWIRQTDTAVIVLEGASFAGNVIRGNVIVGNRLGVVSGAARVQIGPANVVSGNTEKGIQVFGTASVGTTVRLNFVGTDRGGDFAIPNGKGIEISAGPGILVEDNVASGNTTNGILVYGPNAIGTVLVGNKVGVSAAGDRAIPNGQDGILVSGGARDAVVGPANTVSGNGAAGILVYDPVGTTSVLGNFVGTDPAGRLDLGNQGAGISISGGGNGVAVNGNVVSGNAAAGLQLGGGSLATHSLSITGNLIGVGLDGASPIPNDTAGVSVGSGTTSIIDIHGNVVSGNRALGFSLHACVGIDIRGNAIGVDLTRSLAVPNGSHGIQLSGDARGNRVFDGNVISGNTRNGIAVYGGRQNDFFDNAIGVDATRSIAIPNGEAGVTIGTASVENVVGPDNTISGNGTDGVLLGTGAQRNRIESNRIGLDANGLVVIGNAQHGVRFQGGASENLLGPGNHVTGNGSHNVAILGAGTSWNDIEGNSIGLLAVDGRTVRTQTAVSGVYLDFGSTLNRIGSNTDPGRGNVISGNGRYGIELRNTQNNLIVGNLIGTDHDGVREAPNRLGGIYVGDQARLTTIGMPGLGNRLAFNGGHQIFVEKNAAQTVVSETTMQSLTELRVLRDGNRTPLVSHPWIEAVDGADVIGRVFAPDGAVIELFFDPGLDVGTAREDAYEYLGRATVNNGKFRIRPLFRPSDFRYRYVATVTPPGGSTMGPSRLEPSLALVYRNSSGFDVIPGHWDHVGLRYRFASHQAMDLVVEATLGSLVRTIAFEDFAASAAWPQPTNLHAISIPLGHGVFDWLFDNEVYRSRLQVDGPHGYSSYNALPRFEKGIGRGLQTVVLVPPDSYSCVGLSERSLEESGLDLTPGLLENPTVLLVRRGWPSLLTLPFLPSVQHAIIAPGNRSAEGGVVRVVAREEGRQLQVTASSEIPHGNARSKVTIWYEKVDTQPLDALVVESTASGTLGVHLAQPGQPPVAGARSFPAQRWTIPFERTVAEAGFFLIDVFFDTPMPTGELSLDELLRGGSSDVPLRITLQPEGYPGDFGLIEVPSTVRFIQNAIDMAVDGQTIHVRPGTYDGAIDFRGKRVVLRSTDGPEETILRGYSQVRPLTFAAGEGRETILDGFTIVEGRADEGGAILCRNASPTIRNCILRGNVATLRGGAVSIEGGAPRLENLLLFGNTAPTAAGIHLSQSTAELMHVTVTANVGGPGTGGVEAIGAGGARIENSIVWGNSSGPAVEDLVLHNGAPTLRHSNLAASGLAGPGLMNIDPGFLSGAPGALAVGSPMVDAGDPATLGLTPTDLFGQPRRHAAPDLGADERGEALLADRTELSRSQQEVQTWRIDAGPAFAGRPYLVIGTMSGISPGFSLDAAWVPLNLDVFSVAGLSGVNAPPYAGSFGTLDGRGRADGSFQMGSWFPAVAVGSTLNHVLVVFGPTGIEYVDLPVPCTVLD